MRYHLIKMNAQTRIANLNLLLNKHLDAVEHSDLRAFNHASIDANMHLICANVQRSTAARIIAWAAKVGVKSYELFDVGTVTRDYDGRMIIVNRENMLKAA